MCKIGKSYSWKTHESERCRVSSHPVYQEAGFQSLLLSLQEYVAYPVMT